MSAAASCPVLTNCPPTARQQPISHRASNPHRAHEQGLKASPPSARLSGSPPLHPRLHPGARTVWGRRLAGWCLTPAVVHLLVHLLVQRHGDSQRDECSHGA